MTKESTICKNCGNIFQLKYCNSCGQLADTYKITWKELFHHLPHAFFHIDSGFFYTIKELATRPGNSIREYLEGKRKRHFNPFMLLIILTGFCSYLYVYFHLHTIFASIRMDQLEVKNALIAHKFFFARTIFFCILCSIGDYLMFREKKYTLPEMMVVNVFWFSGISVLQLLFIPLLLLGKFFGIIFYVQIIFISIVLTYLFVSHFQFYQAKNNSKLILKIIIALMIYIALIFIIGFQLVKPVLAN